MRLKRPVPFHGHSAAERQVVLFGFIKRKRTQKLANPSPAPRAKIFANPSRTHRGTLQIVPMGTLGGLLLRIVRKRISVPHTMQRITQTPADRQIIERGCFSEVKPRYQIWLTVQRMHSNYVIFTDKWRWTR